jgi:hypothetical protein
MKKGKKKKRWYGILRGTNKGRRTIFIRRNSNQEKNSRSVIAKYILPRPTNIYIYIFPRSFFIVIDQFKFELTSDSNLKMEE